MEGHEHAGSQWTYDFLLGSYPGLAGLALWVAEAVLAGEPAAVPRVNARPSTPTMSGSFLPSRAVLQLSGWPGSVGAMGIEDETVPR